MSAAGLPKEKDDPRCSCVTGQYQCGFCGGIERQRIWNRMSAEDRAYDRRVDPANSRTLDAGMSVDVDLHEQGCSCHINPPCSYCVEFGGDQS